MDELLNPAHGISIGAIIFVAGGAWFMLNYLNRRVGRLEKKQEELVTEDDFKESFSQVNTAVRDVANSVDRMVETVSGHIAWAKTKADGTDAKIMEHGERISKQEGLAGTFSAAIQRLDMTVKEVDGVRQRVHDLANSIIQAQTQLTMALRQNTRETT